MYQPSTLTVTQLTHQIKNQLESSFASCTVQGEISNGKAHSSGHFYFDLKDAGAKIPAVMFRNAFSRLDRKPKEGDQVILKGNISVYAPHGRYQMLVNSLEFQGVGELLLRLERLKKKLQERGWFEAEKKKPLPRFPLKIGVVTSPTGAVIRDIIQVLTRRFSGFQLLLNPVRVQGGEAAYEIAEAIEQMNRLNLCDVMIVGRGGGSLEDLWPFNEEIVARAIYESRIPIVSAVGHETDVTLADFVADVRAPTPSAAAELVTDEKQAHLNFLNKMHEQLSSTLSFQMRHKRAQLEGVVRSPLLASSTSLLALPFQRLDECKSKLESVMKSALQRRRDLLAGRQRQAKALKPTTLLQAYRHKLDQQTRRLAESVQSQLHLRKQKLTQVIQALQAVDPKNVLKRGYAILFAINEGSIVVSTKKLIPGQRVEARLADGTKTLSVEDE